MKKLYTLISFAFISFTASATVHVFSVQDFTFAPQTISTVQCGDTVKWQWVGGSHTTTSISVPVGATTWDAPIASATPTYTYVPTVIGNYAFKCTPHFAMNMAGGFVVACASAVPSIESSYLSVAFPNPFSNKITIEFSGADMIALYNVVGEKIRTITLQQGQTKVEINAADLREGIYFYAILKKGVVIGTRKIVKN